MSRLATDKLVSTARLLLIVLLFLTIGLDELGFVEDTRASLLAVDFGVTSILLLTIVDPRAKTRLRLFVFLLLVVNSVLTTQFYVWWGEYRESYLWREGATSIVELIYIGASQIVRKRSQEPSALWIIYAILGGILFSFGFMLILPGSSDL